MFDIKWIRANADAFDAALARRNGSFPKASALLAIDDRRRAIIASLNELQEKRNALSKQIGQAKAQKDEARASELMAEVGGLKEKIPAGEAEERAVEAELREILSGIPNLPADEVPTGTDESQNVEYFGRNGTAAQAATSRPPKPEIAAPKEHFELGEAMGFMDFEIAAKLSGSRFVVLKSQLARMERALGQFMLDLHTNAHGYMEVQPPLLVEPRALFGTGQLPKFEDDLFKTQRLTPSAFRADMDRHVDALLKGAKKANQRFVKKHLSTLATITGPEELRSELTKLVDRRTNYVGKRVKDRVSKRADRLLRENTLYLIPTAEVPLTNLVRESILDVKELPLRFTALTPCFRSEAGSAGRDTRGMLRQHQFDKVEMVSITTPATSRDEHERMLDCAETVLKKLGLHYRVMTLCTGDTGFGAQKTYDLEVWLPGQGTYREISSVSICGDFQARRMDARFKGTDGKPQFVHTLNGSGTAVGRALIAVMENYQNADGSVAVPDVLQPYMGGLRAVGAKS